MNHILSNLQNEVSSLMFADKGLIENINKGNNYNIYNFEFLKIIKKKTVVIRIFYFNRIYMHYIHNHNSEQEKANNIFFT